MIWTALALGLFGSLHCIGMCGPIALAIPGSQVRGWALVANALQYSVGRVATYVAMGLVFGAVGTSVRLAGWQSWLSVSMGVMVLVFAFFTVDFERKIMNLPMLRRFYESMQRQLGQLLRRNTGWSSLLIGLFNGFLPCGLVYAAIFGAISTGSILSGAAFMAIFGLGTVPMLFSVSVAGQWMSISWRKRLRRLIPVFLTIMATLLIARGLNFDLPYDFRFWQEGATQPTCH
jgi:hypothetical protein